MTLTNVETFEHDIASEILAKEATVTQAASAENLISEVTQQVNPTADTPKTSSSTVYIILAVFFLVVCVLGYVGYTYYKNKGFVVVDTGQTPVDTQAGQVVTVNTVMKSFPILDQNVGRFVSNSQKVLTGFAISFTDYSQVFSYIIKNETTFASEAGTALNLSGHTSADLFIFTDVTLANQNIRIGNIGNDTIAYAFVGNDKLIIATSTDAIIAIKNAIIK